ncbi:MAG: ACT domain-containing protein [Pseudoflavonifractor sp.]
MTQKPKYFIVEAQALPEIFLKVAEAKRMLETGESDTVNQATRVVGISRSAFYKYKDSVRPFNDMLHGRIVTFQIMLKDQPGILSAVLNIFARTGGNILTINQGIPVSGCAAVTIGAETSGMEEPVEELLARLSGQEGVLRCETLAG